MIKDSYCSYCGNKSFVKTYPKQCFYCGQITYANPISATNMLIRVFKDHKVGFLLVHRKNEPAKNTWALPGGYLDAGETWEEGTIREVLEETGLVIPKRNLFFHRSISEVSNNTLLIFAGEDISPMIRWEDIKFSPNSEVSELKVGFYGEKLGFRNHQYIFDLATWSFEEINKQEYEWI